MAYDFVRIFKALSNDSRLKILKQISEHEVCGGFQGQEPSAQCCTCVGDIVEKFKLAPSTISHHIKELSMAGLVKVERDGQFRSLSAPEPFEVKPLRQGALEGRPQEVVDAFWSNYAQVSATNNAVSKRFSNLKNELQAIKKSLEVSRLDNADFNLEYDELLSAYQSLNRRYKGDANKNQTGQKNDPTIGSGKPVPR